MLAVAALVGIALTSPVPPPGAPASAGADLRAEDEAIRARERDALKALADRLASSGAEDEAEEVRRSIEPEPPAEGPTRFVPLPEVIPAGPPRGRSVATADPPRWRAEQTLARTKTARDLFDLAGRSAEAGRYALADECLRGVLDRDPGHREARRLMGYVTHEGGWAIPHAAQNLREGMVLDPVFGWVKADWVPHLRRGELPAPAERGRPVAWLPAAEADALRREWGRGWRIKTEHFDITTNVPLSEAIAFGRRLEALRDAFFALFADVYEPRLLPLARRFHDPKRWARPSDHWHEVYYFAEKDEYVTYLTTLGERRADLSLGVYLTPRRLGRQVVPSRSYFFRDVGGAIDVTATLFHEASHQLLFETAGPTSYDRNVGQYWVWEGLGTYFETFEARPDGSYQIGGRVGPRMAKARRDIVEERQLVPTSDFTTMSKARFNDDRDVYRHYAEAMALADFLMHYDGGRYREGFLAYVREAYQGRFRPGGSGRPLDVRLGVGYSTLDAQLTLFLGRSAETGGPKEDPIFKD